jgi:hypothetical protein
VSAPVLFLDIDGVLNSARWFSARGGPDTPDGLTREEHQIDPAAVAVLNRILDATGAKVVVSSTWRLLHTPAAIHRILRRRGFAGKIIGRTPNLSASAPYGEARGHEIEAWLTAHDRASSTPSPICIVDDDADMAHLAPFLVKTSFQDGLTEAHVERCVALLGGARPSTFPQEPTR